MDNRRAVNILARMQSTWTQRELTELEQREWLVTLHPFAVQDVETALGLLRANTDWMPTHRQFIETTQAAARRRALAEAEAVPVLDETAGPAVQTPKPEGAERVRAIKNLLHPVPE